MGEEMAGQILIETIDLNLYVCQNEDRKTIEESIKEHATKGGVLERGCLCFQVLMEDKLVAGFSDKRQGGFDSIFFDWIYHAYHSICEIVALHCERLSGIDIPFEFTEEVAAVALALWFKNIILLEGEKNLESLTAGIKLPFDKNVSGLVNAWEKYGLLYEGEQVFKFMRGGMAECDTDFFSWENHTGYMLSELSRRVNQMVGQTDLATDRTLKDIEIIFGKTAGAMIGKISGHD